MNFKDKDAAANPDSIPFLHSAELSRLLSKERKKILTLWEERTRLVAPAAENLQTHILIDALPEVIDELIEELKKGHETKEVLRKERATALEHADQRHFLTEYTLAEVLQEYKILRDVIFEVLETHGPIEPRARDLILHTMDVEIRYAASKFSDLRLRHETKKTEMSRQSEAYLDALIATTPVGLALIDTNLRYIRINPVLAKMNGLPAKAHIGKTVEEVIPEAKEQLTPMLKEILRTKNPVLNYEVSVSMKAPPHELRHFLINYYPVEADGLVLGIGASVIDITKQKETELRLRESEEFKSLALSSGNIGIWQMDLVSQKVIWSEKQYQLFGIDPKTKISYDTFLKSTHPDDRPAINREFENTLKKRTDFNATFRVIWPNGSIHWIKSNGRAFFDVRGKPLRMFGINVDLTEIMQKNNVKSSID